jgi:hypothetical protein
VVQTVTVPARTTPSSTPRAVRPVSATRAPAPQHHAKGKGHGKKEHGKG